MKWLFYLIVLIYMFYRAVYCAKQDISQLIEPIEYDETGYLPVGSLLTVTCRLTDKNQKVQWVSPNGNNITRSTKATVFAQEHYQRGRPPVLSLVFSKLEVDHSGVYQCRNSKSETQNVSICVIDPSVFVNTPTEVSADFGRAITLTCQAKGKPEPSLTWSVQGQTLTDDDNSSKYRVSTKYNSQGFESLLTIKSLVPEDSGVYSCMSIQRTPDLDDCSFSKKTNITLKVNHMPLFEDATDRYLYTKENELINLTCSANGYPLPTYRWFIDNGNLVEIDQKLIVYSEEENQATWTITTDSTTFDEKFICRATNSYGQAEQVFNILKLEKPRRPDIIKVKEATDNEIKLNVIWNGGALFPIESFHVQILKADGIRDPNKSGWKKSYIVVTNPEGHFDVDLEWTGMLTTVRSLEANSRYWMRIRARNDAGDGYWSGPYSVETISKQEEKKEKIEETSEEVTEEEEQSEPEAENEIIDDANISDGTFYGIFFAGGILVVAAVCMFAMRIV
ncbi:hypothetical protein K1T71_008880 [Dendrolimus kikuchii]|uniref:Uncharacterized protein n=1 Tax=Dendrolimus kikuchii TaxID=765133 RepID=A0ACC1CVU5_9NEOP|nr:hypothetical protein K1T71_008880 [Dendrolimus kikuchii]